MKPIPSAIILVAIMVGLATADGRERSAVFDVEQSENSLLIGDPIDSHVPVDGLFAEANIRPDRIEQMKWQEREVPWGKRSGHSCVVFNEKMWIMGGRMGDTQLSDVWCSADGTRWERVTDDAQWSARYGHVALVHGGLIWVMGGASGGQFKNDVWCSANGRDWLRIAKHAPWESRYGLAAFVKDGKMWIAGGHGRDEEGKARNYNDVWCSAEGGMWMRMADAAPWMERSFMAHAVHDNKMWIVGGGNQGKHLNDVWWSENGVDWIEATPRAAWSERFGHTAVSHNGRLWMLGGQQAGPRFNDVWSTEDGAKWIRHNEHAHWRARNSAQALSHRGDLWVFAGEHDWRKGIADAWRLAKGEAEGNP